MLQPFTVHQAADAASPVLSTRRHGDERPDLKGSFSNWMLIEYPSGVGQLSPGWIELRSVNDPRVTQDAERARPSDRRRGRPSGAYPVLIQIRLPPKKH